MCKRREKKRLLSDLADPEERLDREGEEQRGWRVRSRGGGGGGAEGGGG